ncbi:cyclase family protein [Hoeflea sp.]|uniref:cyclase family protein n=1 Tax=Hoeflea sp. TaxID=1940281 RepID=UPI003B0221CB
MNNNRWTNRPDGSNWGDFGPDDQLGRLNLLTAEKVRQGIAEVNEGMTFCLSMPLDYPKGVALAQGRYPPQLKATERDGLPIFNLPLAVRNPNHREIVSDDVATLTLQYSTHWDALSHVGYKFDVFGNGKPEHVYYNGFRANEDVVGPLNYATAETPTEQSGPYGAFTLDIANLAKKPIQGRAILIDIAHHFGTDRRLITGADVKSIIQADKIVVKEGDIVAFRTGWTEYLMEAGEESNIDSLNKIGGMLDGRDTELLDWITHSGIAAICADNYAVEALPSRDADTSDCALPLHEHCLFKLGIPLGELWALGELAKWLRQANRSAFLLTAPPLYLPHAVGSPVNPVATV